MIFLKVFLQRPSKFMCRADINLLRIRQHSEILCKSIKESSREDNCCSATQGLQNRQNMFTLTKKRWPQQQQQVAMSCCPPMLHEPLSQDPRTNQRINPRQDLRVDLRQDLRTEHQRLDPRTAPRTEGKQEPLVEAYPGQFASLGQVLALKVTSHFLLWGA